MRLGSPRSAAGGEAVRLISSGIADEPGTAELAVTGFPTRAGLRTAMAELAPGGDVVCIWRTPRPGGSRSARRRLEAAGFGRVRVFWAGPLPHRAPQFWLQLDSRAATEYLLASRPPRSRAQAALRGAWRWAHRGGMLAPQCAVARAPGGEAPDEPELLLLTGGEAQHQQGGRARVRRPGEEPGAGDQVRPRRGGRARPRTRGAGAPAASPSRLAIGVAFRGFRARSGAPECSGWPRARSRASRCSRRSTRNRSASSRGG